MVTGGLRNFGNTCFANSVLQVVANSPHLKDALLSCEHSASCRLRQCLVCETEKVVRAMHSQRQVAPRALLSHLPRIGRQFRLGAQEDAHEFMRCLLDKLHEGYLVGLKGQRKKDAEPHTPIHRAFATKLLSRVTCKACNHQSDTWDDILDLSVDIPRGPRLSLQECLRRFFAVEHLDENNHYNCERCKRAVRATKQLSIVPPAVLCVHLKRFTPFGTKITAPVRFPLRFSIASFVAPGASQVGVWYEVYGCVVHEGGSVSSGHYTTYLRDGKEWWCMDDSQVTRVPEGVVGSAKAYVLVYRRCPPTESTSPRPRHSRPHTPSTEQTPSTSVSSPFIGPQPRPQPSTNGLPEQPVPVTGRLPTPPPRAPAVPPVPPSAPSCSESGVWDGVQDEVQQRLRDSAWRLLLEPLMKQFVQHNPHCTPNTMFENMGPAARGAIPSEVKAWLVDRVREALLSEGRPRKRARVL